MSRTALVVVSVAIACIVGRIVWSRARVRSSRGADPSVYIGLRNQALSISRASVGLPASSTPVAALMDMEMNGNTITTVAAGDGDASIYLSNGGGFIGGGQRYDSIKNAALDMLKVAKQASQSMTRVDSYPLPEAGHTSFFVVTDSGVYSASGATKDIERGPQHPLYALYAAGQNVITQYRLTQQVK